jgi:hypothetical protein
MESAWRHRMTCAALTGATILSRFFFTSDVIAFRSTLVDDFPVDICKQRDPMSNVNELVVSYLAAWNERAGERRRDLVAKTWTEGGTYIDAHRRGVGHDAIDAMIKTAQDQFPAYRLRLVSGIETHNGQMRFSWAAGGSAEAPLYLAGTDFAVVAEDGRLRSVIGFVDAAPAPQR